MNCTICNVEMKKANFIGDATGMIAYLAIKEKGFLSGEKRSSVECYVCLDCGKIELKAAAPEKLR